MAEDITNESLLNKHRPFTNGTQNLQDVSSFDEEVDLGWIAAMAKQDLNASELNQLLAIINDYIEQRRTELISELQLVMAYKTILMDRCSVTSNIM